MFPGDSEQLFDFVENQTSTDELEDKFVVSVDADWGEGYSWASLEASPNKKSMLFFGDLNTTAPKDGRISQAGYASIKSITKRWAFGFTKHLDFEYYTAITLKIRGDGRTYAVHIHLDDEWDIFWMDRFTYPLYTRGGPYWQDVTIPFSKFMLTSKGYIQDKQEPFLRRSDTVSNISIVLMDRVNGPFNLEIAQIGLINEDQPDSAREIISYETYKMPHKIYLGSTISETG